MLLVLNKCTLSMLEDSSGHLLQVPEKEEWFRRTRAEGTIRICYLTVRLEMVLVNPRCVAIVL